MVLNSCSGLTVAANRGTKTAKSGFQFRALVDFDGRKLSDFCKGSQQLILVDKWVENESYGKLFQVIEI